MAVARVRLGSGVRTYTYIYYNIIYYSCWFPPAGPSPGDGERGQWLRARALVVPTYILLNFLRDRPTACRTPSERRQLRRRRRRSGRGDSRSRCGSSAGATLEPVWPNLQALVPAVVSRLLPLFPAQKALFSFFGDENVTYTRETRLLQYC